LTVEQVRRHFSSIEIHRMKKISMRDAFANPFPASDADRHAIWTMLVERDIAAFLATDWTMVAGDFIADGFMGIDAGKTDNPDHWRLAFPALDAYRDEWLKQAEDFARQSFAEDPRAAIFNATVLRDIEIESGRAIARKKFDGGILRADGGRDVMNWQTLYYCSKTGGTWKISGFCGYLPNPMGARKA
jgi:hypothetical protein